MKWYIVGVLCVSLLCKSESCYQITNRYDPFPNQQNSHSSLSIKPSNYARYYNNQHASAVYHLSRFSSAHFAHYFGYVQPDILSDDEQGKILEKLELYRYPGFREYVRQFPLYEKHIKNLFNELHHCKKCKKKLIKEAGYKQFAQTIHGLHTQVKQAQQKRAEQQQEFVQQKQQTLQEKPNPPPYVQLNKEVCTEQCNGLLYSMQTVGFSQQHQTYIQKRKEALQSITENVSDHAQQTYQLSQQANNFLKSNNVENKQFTSCYGNELQQVLHTEFVDIVEQAAQKNSDTALFSDTVLDFAYIGSEHNSAGYVLQAFNCADFCHAVLEYGSAVVLGVGDAVENIAHMVTHPKQTAKDMAYGIGIISYYFAKICKQYGVYAATGFSHQSLCELGKTLVDTLGPMYTKIKSMSGPELTRATTALAVETYLMAKCLKGIHKICKRAGSSIRKIITAAENPQLVELPAAILSTPEGIEIQLVRNGLELAGSESLSTLETLFRYHPKLAQYFVSLENLFTELDELFVTFKHTFGEYKDVILKGRARHIFGVEIIEKNKAGGIVKLRISGFHHDYLGYLERSGLVQFAEEKIGISGVYEARPVINGATFRPKTFFPKDWAPEKVIGKITESMKKLTKEPKIEGSRIVLVGKTSEEVTIKTVIDAQSKRLISSYPVMKV